RFLPADHGPVVVDSDVLVDAAGRRPQVGVAGDDGPAADRWSQRERKGYMIHFLPAGAVPASEVVLPVAQCGEWIGDKGHPRRLRKGDAIRRVGNGEGGQSGYCPTDVKSGLAKRVR